MNLESDKRVFLMAEGLDCWVMRRGMKRREGGGSRVKPWFAARVSDVEQSGSIWNLFLLQDFTIGFGGGMGEGGGGKTSDLGRLSHKFLVSKPVSHQ